MLYKIVMTVSGYAGIPQDEEVYRKLAAERFDRFVSSVEADVVDVGKTLKPSQNRNVAKG
jgi:hypothetical protein